MPRWYALDLAARPVGPPFEAPDSRAAYDRGCALFGEACLTVQSALSWELSEAARRATALRRSRRAAHEEE